ncbi:MAG: hypothetical protein ABGX83_04710 [Nitrospira sp.]|nr:hypothetical protein [Candidatus Manganitrophaceae bacterium]HIL35687.1 hypothetical protein [Candidatus Manganitrophaceae bacterium]
MSRYFSSQRVGTFALLFPMLLLPMLHLHPAYEHVRGDAEGHQHQSAVHINFFPEVTHGHERQDDHDQGVLDFGLSIDVSHHSLSQVALLPLHIGQSFQFSSVFKKNLLALDQGSPDLSMLFHFQRGALVRLSIPPLQTSQFSPPSLRAPPYST